MLKVIGFAVLALASCVVQARVYDIDTCGEVNVTGKLLAKEVLKYPEGPSMQDTMDQVVQDSTKNGSVIKKGKGGYHVQQALYFLQENADAYEAKIEHYRNTLGASDVSAELAAVDMGTLCFKKLAE